MASGGHGEEKKVPTFLFSPNGIFFFVEMNNSAVLASLLFSSTDVYTIAELPSQALSPRALQLEGTDQSNGSTNTSAQLQVGHTPCSTACKAPISQSPALPANFILFIGQFLTNTPCSSQTQSY